MTILRASLKHLEQLVPLFDGYRSFYNQPSDPSRARNFLLERLETADSVIFLAVADHADAPALGFTQLYPLFTSVGTSRTWLLNDLYVAPAARRLGIARQLMQAAIDFGREDGAKAVELATQKNNFGAKTLYQDLGFRLDDEYDHYSLET